MTDRQVTLIREILIRKLNNLGTGNLPSKKETPVVMIPGGKSALTVRARTNEKSGEDTKPWLRNLGVCRVTKRTLFCLIFLGLLELFNCTPTGIHEPPPVVDLACSSVKYAYKAKGIFREEDVPQTAISGDHLRICERGLTCCTEEMEHRLSSRSKAEFDKLLKNSVGDLRNIYAHRAQKFDEFFRFMLEKSKKDFHSMFLRTYGLLYETNSYLFDDMFKDLEKYYHSGNVDLTDALDTFFDRLYRKMFQVLNSQYSFTENYLRCVGEHMETLKPFGDIPQKLTLEIKRSFVATRTFVQALYVGRDVLKVLSEVGPTPECSRSLMKMTYCPHCRGLPDLKPCGNYCHGVLKKCLAHHAELDSEWKNYTSNMDLLGGRLESSFNIESVVHPINIKISEAIMNFQEKGPVVSNKLFEVCGRPKLGKRSANPGTNSELSYEKLSFTSGGQHDSVGGGGGGHSGNHRSGYEDEDPSMSTLVQGIKRKIRKTSNFWNQLPEKICQDPKVAGERVPDKNKDKDNKDCWNGQSPNMMEALKVKTGDLSGRIQSDPSESEISIEERIEASHQNSIINQQVLTLKLISNKLHHAYNGLDVDWQDSDSDWMSSGSGSGSGFGPTDGDPTGVPSTTSDIYFSSTLKPTLTITNGNGGAPTTDSRSPPSSAFSITPMCSWSAYLLVAFALRFFATTNNFCWSSLSAVS